MGGDVATPPPYDGSPRPANPLRPKSHLILANDIRPAKHSRNDEFNTRRGVLQVS